MIEGLEATRVSEATHFWFKGFRRFVSPAIEGAAGGRKGLMLLDCGCGTGFNLEMLARHGRAYGIDLADLPGGRHSARADVTCIPFPDRTFDIVTSFDVLQCVREDGRAVREMARVLKPGGTLILTLAAFDALRGTHAEIWNEHRRYTRRSAAALVGQAGLRAERVSFLFAVLFPLMLTVRTVQRLRDRREAAAVDGDWEMNVPPAPLNGLLTLALSAEAALGRYVGMPVGSSLLVIATKPA